MYKKIYRLYMFKLCTNPHQPLTVLLGEINYVIQCVALNC